MGLWVWSIGTGVLPRFGIHTSNGLVVSDIQKDRQLFLKLNGMATNWNRTQVVWLTCHRATTEAEKQQATQFT